MPTKRLLKGLIMVATTADFRNKYPQTSFAVRELRHVQSKKPQVFKAFINHTGLDEKHAIAALSLMGTSDKLLPVPEVRIDGSIKGYAKYFGAGDEIALQLAFVQQYEKFLKSDLDSEFIQHEFNPGLVLPYGQLRSKRNVEHGNARLLMESKLLHELVHWGRRFSMLPKGAKDGRKHEEGWMFERDAYGDNIDAKRLGLMHIF